MLQHLDLLICHRGPSDDRAREFRHLYASTSLKIFALSLIGVFVPIYLYSLGFSIASIALFYATHHAARLLLTLPVARLTQRFGVKHILAVSYGLTLIKALLLVTLPDIGWPLWIIASIDGLSYTTYFLPYHAGISKLTRTRTAGRQLSQAYQWHKLAGALGPVLGGLIAYQFGIGTALLVTAMLVGLSIIPLTRSPEPLREPQNLKLARLPWARIRPDLISQMGIAINQMGTGILWGLFLGVYIFTQDTYLNLGFLISLSLLLTISLARVAGRLVDTRRGLKLLRTSAVVQSLTHVGRLAVTTAPAAYGLNIAAQPSTIGIGLAYSQGVAARGRELAQHRILYMATMELAKCLPKLLVWLAVFAVAGAGHEKIGLQAVFWLSIPASWLILSERFPSLRLAR